MNIKTLQVDPIGTNCYIVSDEQKNAFIVDPGGNASQIVEAAEGFDVQYIFLTHTHYDHIGALDSVARAFPDAKVAVHYTEKEALYDASLNLSVGFGLSHEYAGDVHLELNDNDILEFGDTAIKVIHTPGHTVGGVCYYVGTHLFSGDTLFKSSVGRTDLPGGDAVTLLKSIREKLYTLPGKTIVYPGHMETTSISWEKQRNPYVKGNG